MLPNNLLNKLKEQYPNQYEKIIEGYQKEKYVTCRVNTIKSTNQEIEEVFSSNGIEYENVLWYQDAYIIKNKSERDMEQLSVYQNGKIYLQSLSSMIPPLVLNPQKEETILDMTAAPGSKTTQIAALANNQVLITASEKNLGRMERLKYNIEKLGVKKVNVINKDARYLDDFYRFDKVLLDAPCSGSGTIIPSTNLQYFTEEFFTRCVKTQEQLLLKAIQCLNQNSTLIYSTCSVLKEENEQQLQKLIEKKIIDIIPIDEKLFETLPKLPVKIPGTLCVCPNEFYEGFFVAKIKRKE